MVKNGKNRKTEKTLKERLKTLFGVGPLLIGVFLVIEGLFIIAARRAGIPIGLSPGVRIGLAAVLGAFLLAGLIWFNATLRLIEISFKEKKKELVITGPFIFVRHPLYAVLSLTLPGFFVLRFDDYLFLLPWVLTYTAAYCIVRLEEGELLKLFGDSYERYRRYVPALFPFRGAAGRRFRAEILSSTTNCD